MFSGWLNLHRPCLFATKGVSNKGKIKKVYQHKDAKTPLECLVLRNETELVARANEQPDLQAAHKMQRAKAALFAMFNKPGRKNQTSSQT